MAPENAKSKILQFRVDPSWLDQFDHNRENLHLPQKDSDRSTYARDLLGIESAFLAHSPFICFESRQFLLITRHGDLLYYGGEALRLNTPLSQIPGSLAVLRQEEKGEDASHFFGGLCLRGGDGISGRILDEKAIRGKVGSTVALECRMPEGAILYREGCAFKQGHAQYLDTDRQELHDGIEYPVEIPIKHLDLIVVLDRELYANTRLYGESFKPSLDFTLHNGQGVPFANLDSYESALQGNVERVGTTYPLSRGRSQGANKAAVTAIEERFTELKTRIGDWVPEEDGDDETARMAMRMMQAVKKLPETYAFYRIHWTWPHIGLRLSVNWPRPEAP